MHIPDGFLSFKVWGMAWLFSLGGLGLCVKKTKEFLKDRMVPLMGVMSAFIFAAQMLNFPVIGGTSGHLLGGVLSAALLGPWAGAIVISCVLMVQCLIFQDGGLTALGANILNMSFIGAMGAFLVYKAVRSVIKSRKGILIASAFSAWLSVVVASSACAIELVISGTSPFMIVFPAMLGVHILIGIGEAIITALVVGFVLKVRPDLIYNLQEV